MPGAVSGAPPSRAPAGSGLAPIAPPPPAPLDRFERGSTRIAKARSAEWIQLERAARGITKARLKSILDKLCKDPSFESREVGTPGYDRAAGWVAGELEKLGLETSFDRFRWRERYDSSV